MSTGTHSIPIIPLWGQLIVPLQGVIADHQVSQLTEDVLETIERASAEGVIIDVSGVALIDSHLCSMLARLARSAALMGARSVICGLTPEIALTLLAMGVDFDGVETALSLEGALALLGVHRAHVADEVPFGLDVERTDEANHDPSPAIPVRAEDQFDEGREGGGLL